MLSQAGNLWSSTAPLPTSGLLRYTGQCVDKIVPLKLLLSQQIFVTAENTGQPLLNRGVSLFNKPVHKGID